MNRPLNRADQVGSLQMSRRGSRQRNHRDNRVVSLLIHHLDSLLSNRQGNLLLCHQAILLVNHQGNPVDAQAGNRLGNRLANRPDNLVCILLESLLGNLQASPVWPANRTT